jgi:lipopolysaccharide transport system permease protein
MLEEMETLAPDQAGNVTPPEPSGPETIRLKPTKGFSRVLAPKELWRYRDLAAQIAMRDVTIRYRQTALGAAWAVLQPIGFMVVFSLIFGELAGVSSDGLPYPLFSLAALVPWTFFATSLQLGSDSLVSNSELVSKIYFPRIFMPAGVIVASLVDLGVSLVILFILVFCWGLVPSPAVLLLPFLVLVAAAAALGISAALSAINVRYRDVRYVVPFGIQLWLFATPVAYSATLLGQPWRTVAAINPMVGVVEGFRWAALDSAAPLELIAVSTVSALVILVAGLAYFDRAERAFADYV